MSDEPHHPGSRVPWRWLAWTIRVRDDRGVIFPCKGVSEGRYRKEGDLSPSDLRSASYRPRFQGGWWTFVLVIVTVVVPVLVLCSLLVAARRHGMPLKHLVGPIFVGSGAVVMGVHRMTVMRWTAEQALYDGRDKLLAEGKCLACGYSLAEVGEHADGLRVCPECGAAWRIGDARGGDDVGGVLKRLGV